MIIVIENKGNQVSLVHRHTVYNADLIINIDNNNEEFDIVKNRYGPTKSGISTDFLLELILNPEEEAKYINNV